MTSQREVRGLIASVMLAGHNMFNMKRDDIVVLMDAAIFTAVGRPDSDKRSGLCVHL
jgi:hypothetical protein